MDAWTQTHQPMRTCAVGALVGFFLSGVSAPVCASWDGGIAGCFDSFQTAMETVCAINNPDSTSIPGYVYYRDKCVMTSTPNFVIYAHRVILSTGESVSFAYTASLTQCVFTISLSGGTEVEPSKGGDKSTLPFIATIKDQNKQLVTNPFTVRVSVKVEDPKSGGHEHGDSTRPRGGIANVGNCESDGECWWDQTNNGAVVFNFNAPEASGTHTITATCDGCSNTATKTVDVKVVGLEVTPSSPFYVFIGETDKHTDNHYLTPEAAAVLWRIAVSYQVEQQFKLQDPATGKFTVTPPVLHVNDASLKWGGKFDLSGRWAGPHYEHRRGTVIDIRANTQETAIPDVNFDKYILLADRYGVDALLEEPDINRRHFHLRLLNREE